MSESAPAAPAAAPASAPATPPQGGGSQGISPFEADSFKDFADALRQRASTQQVQTKPLPNSPEPPTAHLTKPVNAELTPEAQAASKMEGGEQIDPQMEQPPAAPDQQAVQDAQLLEKVKAWMNGGAIPDELLDAMVELKDGDRVDYESLREVKEGRMRRRDHSRAYDEWTKKEETYKARLGVWDEHVKAIVDPETGGDAMYEIYTRQGLRPQLMQVARRLAQEEQEDLDAANGYGFAVMQRHGIKDWNDYRVKEAITKEQQRREQLRMGDARQRAIEFENHRLKQAQQQRQDAQQSEEYRATVERQLSQLRPRAFKALGITDNSVNDQTFRQFLGAQAARKGT